MATKSLTQSQHRAQISSFDVLCKIGTVQLGAGEHPAHVAAFMLIAEHDAPGEYSFPMANGGTYEVTVKFAEPDDAHADQETY